MTEKILEKIDFENDMPVKCRIISVEEYPWRYHQTVTVLMILEGEVKLKLSFANYTLTKNSIHTIHGGDIYGIERISADNRILMIHFDVEKFEDVFPNLNYEVFVTRTDDIFYKKEKMNLLAERLIDLATDDMRSSGRVRAKATEILGILHDYFQCFTINMNARTCEHKQSKDSIEVDRMSSIVSYIYRNHDTRLRLDDIARNENLGKTYLSHLFQQYVGENFRNFVSMVRVEISEALLLETNTSVSGISEKIGFSNRRYFIENFVTWFKMHPDEYRERNVRNTIKYQETLIREYSSAEFPAILDESSNGKGEKRIESIIDFPEFSLGALGDILEIEVIPRSGDCTYKLRLDADCVKSAKIITK